MKVLVACEESQTVCLPVAHQSAKVGTGTYCQARNQMA